MQVSAIMGRLSAALSESQRAKLARVNVQVVDSSNLEFKSAGKFIQLSRVFLVEPPVSTSAPLLGAPKDDHDSVLAFAFAHEIAHHVLPSASWDRPASARERSADAFALQLVRAANFQFDADMLMKLAVAQASPPAPPVGGGAPDPTPSTASPEACVVPNEIALRAIQIREIDRLSRRDLTFEVEGIVAAREVNEGREERRQYLKRLDECDQVLEQQELGGADAARAETGRWRFRIAQIRAREMPSLEEPQVKSDRLLTQSSRAGWVYHVPVKVAASAGFVFTGLAPTSEAKKGVRSDSGWIANVGVGAQFDSGSAGLEFGFSRFTARVPDNFGSHGPPSNHFVDLQGTAYRAAFVYGVRFLWERVELSLVNGLGYGRDVLAVESKTEPVSTNGVVVLSRGQMNFRLVGPVQTGIATQFAGQITFNFLTRGELDLMWTVGVTP